MGYALNMHPDKDPNVKHPLSKVHFTPVESGCILNDDTLLVTQEPVLKTVHCKLPSEPSRMLIAESLDEVWLETQAREQPDVQQVVGMGGGTAIDAAKYLAWRWQLPLTLIPSALTVDAPFTESIAVRRDGRIHYLGEIYPEKIIIDTELIQSAPKPLNRGGVGDLLSIHTALYDWQLAHQRTGEAYDAAVAAQSASILSRLHQHSLEVREVTEAGIRLMVGWFCEEVALCHQVRSSRPEEGSEHHLLYNLEARTGKTYLHGPAVTLCALIIAYLQENEAESLRRLADACGVDYGLASLDISSDSLRRALLTANEYAIADGLPYTFLREANLSPNRVDEALDWMMGR